MIKQKYCCMASRPAYLDYYMQQSGNGMPIFQGYRGQRGHGLGSMLARFFRSAVPILKKGLSFLLPEALRTGAKIATDVAEGQSFGESAKKRVRERIKI